MLPKRQMGAPASSRPSRATKKRAGNTIHQPIGRRGRQLGPSIPSGAIANSSTDPAAIEAILEALPQFQGGGGCSAE